MPSISAKSFFFSFNIEPLQNSRHKRKHPLSSCVFIVDETTFCMFSSYSSIPWCLCTVLWLKSFFLWAFCPFVQWMYFLSRPFPGHLQSAQLALLHLKYIVFVWWPGRTHHFLLMCVMQLGRVCRVFIVQRLWFWFQNHTIITISTHFWETSEQDWPCSLGGREGIVRFPCESLQINLLCVLLTCSNAVGWFLHVLRCYLRYIPPAVSVGKRAITWWFRDGQHYSYITFLLCVCSSNGSWYISYLNGSEKQLKLIVNSLSGGVKSKVDYERCPKKANNIHPV